MTMPPNAVARTVSIDAGPETVWDTVLDVLGLIARHGHGLLEAKLRRARYNAARSEMMRSLTGRAA